MSGHGLILALAIIVGISILLLKGFDRIAGRGPKQVRDGVEAAGQTGGSSTQTNEDQREPCPYCAEQIKPAATICRYCNQELPDGWSDRYLPPDWSPE